MGYQKDLVRSSVKVSSRHTTVLLVNSQSLPVGVKGLDLVPVSVTTPWFM